MPAFANITVKKADGTTDIVYTGMVRSSGTSPAVWQAPGSINIARPELRVTGRDSKQGVRELRVSYVYPEAALNTTTGVYSIINRAAFAGSFLLPRSMADTATSEAAHQFGNLMGSLLARQMFAERYPAS